MSLIPTGDYGEQHRLNPDATANGAVGTGDTATTTPLTVRDANHVIWVQRIFVSITTYPGTAKVWTWQDSTGLVIATINIPNTPASTPGPVIYEVDFGPHGFPLTKGANLQLALSAAGAAGVFTIDAYQRLTESGVAQGVTNS